ncbi:hypothetical protein BDR07DRAFT_1384993 [Suillus spraguei]|nr:hypothetical protein BDR07DRAFT_1384993 [Suillus spraguei]
MARKYHKVAAARARLTRQTQVYPATLRAIASDDKFEMDWESDSESDSGESVVELEGKELESSLAQLRDEVTLLAEPTPYQKVAGPKTSKNWKKAERSRGLGYDGH